MTTEPSHSPLEVRPSATSRSSDQDSRSAAVGARDQASVIGRMLRKADLALLSPPCTFGATLAAVLAALESTSSLSTTVSEER